MVIWQPLNNAIEVADRTVELINIAARTAIQEKGYFSLVLAGGSTPRLAYEKLAKQDHQWSHWKLYYGDERCLPINDNQRNSQMVISTGLCEHITQHYPISGELGNLLASQQYEQVIEDEMPFDMVLLGLGEDGHTASLFPDHPWPQSNVAAISHSPKPPSDRVSLSAKALQNCQQMLVLVTGDNKKHAVKKWRDNDDALPINRVCNVDHCTVLIEKHLIDSAN